MATTIAQPIPAEPPVAPRDGAVSPALPLGTPDARELESVSGEVAWASAGLVASAETGGRIARLTRAIQPGNRLATLAARLALRLRGTRPGPRFFVHGRRPRFVGQGRISIGARVNLRCDVAPVRIEVARGAGVTLADRAFLNTGVQVICHSAIEIGPHCRIGPDCVLCDTNHHPVHEGSAVRVAPIRLGRNVWLGRGVIVLPGVTIGDHAVVAAGSVVASDIPAGQVWRGNPASFVKAVRCSADFVRP